MKSSFISFIACTLVALGLSQCKDPAPSSRPLDVSGDVQGASNTTTSECLTRTALASASSWNSGIGTIFQNNCGGCHPGSRTTNYTTYAGVKGNLDDISSQIQRDSMPKGKTMSQNDKLAVITWMAAGAPEMDNTTIPGSTTDPCQQTTATPTPYQSTSSDATPTPLSY